MNKFKTTKTIFFLALIFIGALMISCDDDDDEDPSIVGTWHFDSIIIERFVNGILVNERNEDIEEEDEEVFTFKSDGTFSILYSQYAGMNFETPTYTIVGDSITLNYGPSDSESFTFSLTSTELRLITVEEYEDEGGPTMDRYTYIFIKE